jgi:hypothetical protein
MNTTHLADAELLGVLVWDWRLAEGEGADDPAAGIAHVLRVS